jgi:hypothetical protein
VKAVIAEELQLDPKDLELYLFAGEMVVWERELCALDPVEREAVLEEFEQDARSVDIDQFRPAIEEAARAREEVQQLEEMFREDNA